MPATCSPLLNDLATILDVNESKNKLFIEDSQDGFVLAYPNVLAACTQLVTDPFDTFCLLPDPSQRLTSTMCSFTTQTNQPDSIFERLVRGDISHPDDLPSIWESADLKNDLPSDVPWITVQDLKTQGQITLSNNDYVGLETLKPYDDMAVANDCKCMHLLKDGILFEAQADGFVRAVLFDETTKELVQGANDDVQSVIVSSSGRVRVAQFSNILYLFVNGKWKKIATTVESQQYFKSVLWETRGLINVAVFYRTALQPNTANMDIYKLKDSDTTNTLPIVVFKQYSQSVQEGITLVFGFLAVVFFTDGRSMILSGVSVASAPIGISGGVLIQGVDVSADGQVFSELWTTRWNTGQITSLSTVSFPIGPIRNCSVGIVEPDQTSILVKTSLWGDRTATFRLTIGIGEFLTNVADVQLGFVLLKHSLNQQQTLVFVSTDGLLSNAMIGSSPVFPVPENQFSLQTDPFFVFAVAPNGTDIWIFRGGVLYRLHNKILQDPTRIFESAWTTDFNLYSAQHAKCSDFGTPDLNPTIYTPGESTWYLGTKTQAKSIAFSLTVPQECIRSPHDRFRFVITQRSSQTTNGLIAFAHIEHLELQRANEYTLCHLGFASISDDSNVQVNRGSNEEILWQSHTHDRVNDNSIRQQFFPLLTPFAASSKNGLYLVYVSKKNRLRLVFNGFNALRFTRWCAQNPELLGKAIDMQSNFCWNGLKNLEPDPLDFADSRCRCIGGERLFHLIAPHADDIPSSVAGPLQENLPCLVTGCNVTGENNITNVGTYVAQRCANRSFVFCDTLLQLGKNASLINGGIIQNTICAKNQEFCDPTHPCGPGLTCSNGRCLTTCANDEECYKTHGDVLIQRCVNGACQPSLLKPRTTQLPLIAIFGLIAGIIFLLLILLFVGLLAARFSKRKKNTKNKNV